METVYLALGSNLGDRQQHLANAQRALKRLPETVIAGQSPVYETDPVGPQDQGPFLNSVLALATRLGPRLLLGHTQRIEREAGRARQPDRPKWGPRELDLDILVFSDRRIRQPGLTVPHPHLGERWFVLKPLADLAPELVPPGFERTVRDMLAALESEQPAKASEPAKTGAPS
jgi:2-amino-4-hydroxy-6-hydroxymethyldihydropteridine diphosphokinase